MTRLEILAELERIIAESLMLNDEQPGETAERVLDFLDSIGYEPA